MTPIRGSYPGGPKREGAADPGTARATPRLETVEEREGRIGRATRAIEQRRRRRRVWSGLVAALVLAAGIGFYLGVSGHRSSEEITSERMAPGPSGKFDPSLEINRLILEMWKTEDVDHRRPFP